MQFPPSEPLKPYVKCYLVVAINDDVTEETFFPSGYVDLAIQISGSIITIIDGRPITMPKVEVLGQLTVPTRLTVTRGTVILVAKIYPFANALFFPNPISDFTNDSIDLDGVLGKESNEFHYQLMEAGTIEQKVAAVDAFLLQQLKKSEKLLSKVTIIEQICRHIHKEGELFNLKLLSDKYGFSERYIQKLFLNNVGVTPRTFFHLQRFNKSLELVQTDHPSSLTSIAYDCGYFDQAHFIKEFKRFTGLTPSEARALRTVE